MSIIVDFLGLLTKLNALFFINIIESHTHFIINDIIHIKLSNIVEIISQ